MYEHYKIPVSSKRVTSYILPSSSSTDQNQGYLQRHQHEEKGDEKEKENRTQEERPDSLRQKSNSVRVKTGLQENDIDEIVLRQHQEQEKESVHVPPHPPPRPATLLKIHEMNNIHDYTNTKGSATEFIQRASPDPFSGVGNFQVDGKLLAVNESVS